VTDPFLLAAQHTTQMAPDVSVGHLLVQMALWLAVIVGALFGLSKLAQRAKGGARRTGKVPGTRGDGLTVVSRQPVGKGQWIAVVEAEGQRVLVGISAAGFTPLGELRSDGAAGGPDAEVPGTLTTSLGASARSLGASARSLGTPDSSLVSLLAASGASAPRSWLDRARAATVRR